ncbi:hypothetical protein COO60DRAFT_794147 [Scenedesmus sp. NREL 46B-D3]|nr:hypothetical protein COO60DRAFT_794147 [Scenedesmus sp. NREL 46B-D3]
MLAFTPCELHAYLQGRTLWLIGDSLMQNFYYALRCLVLDFWDHSLGECQVSKDAHIARAIYQAADTNTSSPAGSRVITNVPRCLWLNAGGRICWLHSVRGEELADPNVQSPGLLQTLHRMAAEPQDIFYVNFGRWHFNNCQGLQAGPYKQALRNLGRLYEKSRDEFPNLIFKVSAHDHTACGDAAHDDQVGQCLPAAEGGYPLTIGRQVMLSAENILTKFGVPIVNTYNETVKLHAGHITDRPVSGREVDCIHYCSPGVPEFEIWSMYKAFRLYGIRPLATADRNSSRRRRRARVHVAETTDALAAAAAAAGSADDGDTYAAELADLMVNLGPAGSSSSSSSSSSSRRSSSRSDSSSSSSGVSTAVTGDRLNDLIGWIGRRSPGTQPLPPNPPAEPPPAAVPKDPSPRCVPIRIQQPPPGWSYYYDSLKRRGREHAGQLSVAEVANEDEEEIVLGTCRGGDELVC